MTDHHYQPHDLVTKLALLKTPSSVETEGGVMEIRPGCDGHYKLRDQIAMLPTPNMFDYNVPETKIAYEKRKAYQAEKGVNLQMPLKTLVFQALNPPETIGTSRGLKLQPIFCEWMMNYPLGFTAISKE
jgi:hypothetical protein